MKKFISIILLVISFMGVKAQETNQERALKALDLILKHDYYQLELMFDTSLYNGLSRHYMNIKEIWPQLEKRVGPFQKSHTPLVEKTSTGEVCSIVSDFEKGSLTFQTLYNKDGRMTGIFFRPVPSKIEYSLPSYADTSSIIEQPVFVITGKYKLNGMLMLPKGKTNVPLVVLVHGSGPGDMDGTAFKNKPFKDLALGLAMKGIATIRYNKRTFSYGNDFKQKGAHYTVKEETIDDAISAIKLAKKTPGVDSSKIYILGHSLGGMLAPRIAKSLPVAGVIMMAAPARSLEDEILAQNNYFLPSRELTKEEQKAMNSVKKQVKMVKKIKPDSKVPADSAIFALPLSYWADLNGYKQTLVAKTLKQRMLFLQGDRDFQVTMTDFNLWKTALINKPNTTFKNYLKLNHLFEEGQGRASMEEYQMPSHIPDYVIIDIAQWVERR